MLHVTDSKSKGLTISVDIHDTTKAVILDALLSSANVQYVKTQNDPWYLHFKVDAKDAGAIRSLIAGWYTSMSDIQYGIDTRQQSS
jgi:hypothetical protein